MECDSKDVTQFMKIDNFFFCPHRFLPTADSKFGRLPSEKNLESYQAKATKHTV